MVIRYNGARSSPFEKHYAQKRITRARKKRHKEGGVVAKTRLEQGQKDETKEQTGPARASLPEPLLEEPPYEFLPMRRLPSIPLPWLDEEDE